MIAEHARLLTDEQAQALHAAALVILEEVGLLIRHEAAREVFREHGAQVDSGTQRVRMPAAVVEHWRQAFPAEFRFYGRDPKFDITLPRDGPVISTSGSAPNVIDLETGEERRATSLDIARMAHLVNELPGFDIFSISTVADDAPPDMDSLSRFYPAAKNCLKPVMAGSLNPRETDDIVRMGEIIAGGKAAYWEHPFLHFVQCPTVSPLTMDYNSTGVFLDCAQRGISALAVVGPNGGLTAPLTLAGVLAVANAEFLATSVLAQMARAGTPVMYYTLPAVGDMRTGAYAIGGIESGILHMACAQLARLYGVPSGGYIGLTNAKVPDAQAGYEKGLSSLAGMLAGEHMLVLGGLLDAGMAFSYAQAVIDSEIGEMIKRVQRGVAFNEDELALDLIAAAGPGGMYLDSEHTFRHMHTAAFLPTLADRASRVDWAAAGKADTHRRAMDRVRDILTGGNPAVFSPDVDAQIQQAFAGLVAGDSEPPASWTQTGQEPRKEAEPSQIINR